VVSAKALASSYIWMPTKGSIPTSLRRSVILDKDKVVREVTVVDEVTALG
jgi:hypothetical protein